MYELIRSDNTTDHNHTNMVTQWGFDKDHNWTAIEFACSKCTVAPQAQRFDDQILDEIIDHSNCHENPCFGCRIKTVGVMDGDAALQGMSSKKWDNELNGYASARKQGIQPAGTTAKAVREAEDASQKLGRAYNAESMPAAQKITKQTAQVIKETGVA